MICEIFEVRTTRSLVIPPFILEPIGSGADLRENSAFFNTKTRRVAGVKKNAVWRLDVLFVGLLVSDTYIYIYKFSCLCFMDFRIFWFTMKPAFLVRRVFVPLFRSSAVFLGRVARQIFGFKGCYLTLGLAKIAVKKKQINMCFFNGRCVNPGSQRPLK